LNNGGKQVEYYEITYDQGKGISTVLETTWSTGLSYTTLPGVVEQGFTYVFKIRSKNSVGFSAYSDTLAIKAAQKPDKPDAPTTKMVGEFIEISWFAPNNRGQTIDTYIIRISACDGIAYLTDDSCNGSDSTVVND
jgi:hypothetical protein